MRNIINAYRGTHKPKGDEFVLFWVKGASTQSLDGYMPLSRRYGFIFSDAISSTTNAQHTIAHELGHGAFALDHPWTLIEGLEKGQSQNLMDYAGGTELWKWQWDQLHNPPVMIGYEQEDEEGRFVRESYSNQIVRIFREISCTLNGNSESSGLARVETSINGFTTITVNNLLKQLEEENEWEDDHSLIFYFTNTSLSLDYHDFTINVNQVKSDFGEESRILMEVGEGNNKLQIHYGYSNKEGYIHGELPTSDERSAIISLISDMMGLNGTYSPLALTYSDDGSIDLSSLELFTTCDYEQLNLQNRKDLLLALANEQGSYEVLDVPVSPDNDTYQLYSSKILETISSSEERLLIYDWFKENPTVVISHYNSIDGGTKGRFLGEILKMWHAKNNTDITKINSNQAPSEGFFKEDIFTLTITDSFFGHGSDVLVFEDGKVSQEHSTSVSNEYVRGMPGASTYTDVGDIFDPVYIVYPERFGADSDGLLVPAILAKSFTDKENWENFKKGAWLTFDVAMIAVGVGEITLAIKGLQGVRFVSTQFVRHSLTLALGVGDILATGAGVLCTNDTTSFCKTWKEYELYVNLGLITASGIDLYAQKLFKSMDELDPDRVRYLMDQLGCFPAGSMIYANQKAFKPIENIKVGDYVDSFDEDGKVSLNKVTEVHQLTSDSLYWLYAKNELLARPTPDHPIFTPGTFRKARDLIEGDSVLTLDGWVEVDCIIAQDTTLAVYNFTVENNLTYFVGKAAIGVHNTSCIARTPDLDSRIASLSPSDQTLLNGLLNEKPGLLIAFNGNPNLVDSWKLIKNAPDVVKRNPKVLSKIDEISKGSSGISSSKITEAFEGDLGYILAKANDSDLDKILVRFDLPHMKDGHLDEIMSKLGNSRYGIKQDLLDNPALFSQFDDMLANPGKYWDMLGDGSIPSGSKLNDWARGKWFKDLREKASKYEKYDPNIPGSGTAQKRFAEIHDIDFETEVGTQITIEINGKRTRLDYLAQGNDGKYHLGEAKFSTKEKDWDTDWLQSTTEKQTDAFPDIAAKSGDIEIRVTDPAKVQFVEEVLEVTKNTDGKYIIPKEQVGSFKLLGSAEDNVDVVETVVDLIK